jgi:glycolate oxidase FAD binding subunit
MTTSSGSTISPDDWLAQTVALIRQANAESRSLEITGSGSKSFYGHEVHADQQLSTLAYAGIVDYDPTELVVVVRSGTRIVDLEALLATSQQMLAFEPPRYGGQGTVGGMMATGLSGPRRLTAGAAKDFVLGMTVLDSLATPMRYGGTVMKNVAGYDLSRLHTGALGTLGLMVDVSLKVLPRPPAEQTICFSVDAEESIQWTNAWLGQPLPISSTSWSAGRLVVRLSGAMAAVRSACDKLGGDRMTEQQADDFWTSLRDQRDAFFQVTAESPKALWRIALPSVTPHLAGFGNQQWIEWAGSCRWVRTDLPAEEIRQLATAHGGHATQFRRSFHDRQTTDSVFSSLSGSIHKIHQRIKHELDPKRMFNPGRLYADL